MAIIDHVSPGDLITSTFMNQVVDKVVQLEMRVAALESGGGTSTGGITITNITSNSSPIRVGSRITVQGTGFSQPPILNTVTIGGVIVSGGSFAFSSSDTQLVFDVPNINGLSESGTSLPLVVTNAASQSASFPITLRPALFIPAGRVEVIYTTPPVMPFGQPNIAVSSSYIFTYQMTTFVDQAATYAVTANITGATGWTVDLLQDSVDLPRPNNIISSAAGIGGVPTPLRLRVNLPGGATTGTLNVNVASAVSNTNIVPGFGVPVVITVGSPPPTPETRVRVTLRGPALGSNGRMSYPRNSTTNVQFNVAVTDAGLFHVAPSMRNPTGWTLDVIDVSQFQVNSPPANTVVNISFTPGALAVDTDLIVLVTRGSDISVPYSLPVSVT